MQRWKAILIAIAVVGSFGLAGHFGYQDDQVAHQRYCKMVETGAWGKYKEGVECE